MRMSEIIVLLCVTVCWSLYFEVKSSAKISHLSLSRCHNHCFFSVQQLKVFTSPEIWSESFIQHSVLWLHSCSLCAPWTCVIKVTPTLNSLLSNSQRFCLHTHKKRQQNVCVCARARASQHVLWQARSTVTSFVLDLILNSSTIQLFGTTVSSRPLWHVSVCVCVLC